MPVEAKTIQIFLPYGEPRGMRIAEITTRIVQAVQVPRSKLDQFFARLESKHIGFYFLFGEKDGSPKPSVYVGQTEDLIARFKDHHAKKDFWTTALAVISRTHSFTQAHLRYLEWFSIQEATKTARYTLENGNSGTRPFLPEPIEADAQDAFETASILLATLGFPVFEPVTGRLQQSSRMIFTCRGPHADARGWPVEDGFVVLKDSLTRRHPVASAGRFAGWLAELCESGVLRAENEQQYRLTQDYLVNSPSYAAALVLARHANGWQEWKLSDGRTLHDVYRAGAEPTTDSTDG